MSPETDRKVGINIMNKTPFNKTKESKIFYIHWWSDSNITIWFKKKQNKTKQKHLFCFLFLIDKIFCSTNWCHLNRHIVVDSHISSDLIKVNDTEVTSVNNSYTPRTLRASCNQSELTILKICKSSTRALFLDNCTPNTLRER